MRLQDIGTRYLLQSNKEMLVAKCLENLQYFIEWTRATYSQTE